MKKFLVKKKWVIIGTFLIVVIAAVIIFAIILQPKPNIEPVLIESISTLSEADDVKAANLIKNNVVKIVNNVGDSDIVGTGFFDSSGYLITNSHIVDIDGKISIVYPDGTTTSATLISNDITSDIALLYVDTPKVNALVYGETLSLQITETVMSVGYDFNLEGDATVTKGALSARRSVAGIEYLQSDAAVNPGGSGGPLINGKAEVIGINCLSSENATINMSISSETLQSIVRQLIEDKVIEYVTDSRPLNAISSVLKEVGYNLEDIYNEKAFLDTPDDKQQDSSSSSSAQNQINPDDDNPNAINSLDDNPLSYNTNLKSLSISGHSLSPSFSVEETSYSVTTTIDNRVLPFNIVTEDDNASYEIVGNSNLDYGLNKIIITVIAENQDTKQYEVNATIPLTRFDRATGILASLDVKYINSIGSNCFHLNFDYIDNERVRVYSEIPLDIVSNVTVQVYTGWSSNDDGVTSDSKPMRLLDTFNFNPQGLNFNDVYIPTSDIRALLTDEDYEGGVYNGADLTFKLFVTTKEQGTFYCRNPWGLDKID